MIPTFYFLLPTCCSMVKELKKEKILQILVKKNWQPKKILAVKLADLGDALLITPALRALKNSYPTAKIEVLTTRGGAILENLPYVDQVLFFDKYSYDSPREALKPENIWKAAKFGGELVRPRYDAVIFFHHFSLAFGALKFAALGLTTLAPLRAGIDNGKGYAWFLNHKMHDYGFGAISEREYWLDLALTLGGRLPEGDKGQPELIVSEAARAKAQKLRESFGAGPVVVLGPGGGGYTLARRWMPVKFAQVADELVKQYDAKIVISGSGAEEVVLADQIARLMQHGEQVVNLVDKTSVPEIVALLEKCNLYIGNDGGLAHLAAIANTPSVVIFGPTNARAWQPFNEKLAIVQAPIALPCRPCLYRGDSLGSRYGCAPRPCLTAISPAQVVQAAKGVLSFEF